MKILYYIMMIMMSKFKNNKIIKVYNILKVDKNINHDKTTRVCTSYKFNIYKNDKIIYDCIDKSPTCIDCKHYRNINHGRAVGVCTSYKVYNFYIYENNKMNCGGMLFEYKY